MEGPIDPIRLVAGLGNPGPRYSGTRHNAGQMVVELLGARLGAGRFATRFGGRLAETRGPAGPLALLVPQTFMNESGDSVGPAAGSLRAAPGQVLVVHDEIDLPFGVVRGKAGGGHGGHNGLRDIIAATGTGDFVRVRMGVGRPPGRQSAADFVLHDFTGAERGVLPNVLTDAADAIELIATDGLTAAQQRFHAPS